jgi:hypothetical protein
MSDYANLNRRIAHQLHQLQSTSQRRQHVQSALLLRLQTPVLLLGGFCLGLLLQSPAAKTAVLDSAPDLKKRWPTPLPLWLCIFWPWRKVVTPPVPVPPPFH